MKVVIFWLTGAKQAQNNDPHQSNLSKITVKYPICIFFLSQMFFFCSISKTTPFIGFLPKQQLKMCAVMGKMFRPLIGEAPGFALVFGDLCYIKRVGLIYSFP